jgi:hypothetical protein
MTTPTAGRHMRLCDVCGGLDDHPRHVTAVPPGFPGAVPTDSFLDGLPDGVPARAVAELMDPGTVVRHMDCCASRGCGVCTEAAKTHDGLLGEGLLGHIQAGGLDHLNTVSEV